jgi:hypothetical protein
LLGKYYKIEIELFIIVYSTIPKMSNYANAAKRGSEILPCDLQPGKVVSVDKEEFYDDDEYEQEVEYEPEDDYKNDPDYVPESEDDTEDEDEEKEDNNEEDGEDEEDDYNEEDDKKKDPDYVPDYEDDSEEDDNEEEEDNEVESEEEDNEVESEDDYINDPDYVPEYISPQYEVEKIFGCDGCNYEWKDGWKQGWKAAMKFVVQQANLSTEAPAPPTCDNCGIACKPKMCSGTCKGAVKYCSKKCQAINWKDSHKFICSKNE